MAPPAHGGRGKKRVGVTQDGIARHGARGEGGAAPPRTPAGQRPKGLWKPGVQGQNCGMDIAIHDHWTPGAIGGIAALHARTTRRATASAPSSKRRWRANSANSCNASTLRATCFAARWRRIGCSVPSRSMQGRIPPARICAGSSSIPRSAGRGSGGDGSPKRSRWHDGSARRRSISGRSTASTPRRISMRKWASRWTGRSRPSNGGGAPWNGASSCPHSRC